MITLKYVEGESKTGQKGNGLSYWYASAGKSDRSIDFDSVGDTPLDAIMSLSNTLYDYISKE